VKLLARFFEGPPTRILVEDPEAGDIFPFTVRVFRAQFPSQVFPGEIELGEQAWQALLAEERQLLLLSAQRYLGSTERSPLALQRWMERRLLPASWSQALEAELRDQSFLSEERFAALWMRRHEERGGRPLWLLRRQLQALGVRRAVAESVAFDEVAALRRYVKVRFPRLKEERLLHARLRRRGFSTSLIRAALAPDQP